MGLFSRVLSTVVRELERQTAAPRRVPPTPEAARPRPRPRRGGGAGDFTGRRVVLEYAPRQDGRPDPGEVVWAWVPYEEDDGRGKDRPVLVAGRAGSQLIGFMMTSKDHDTRRDGRARDDGRVWVDVGTGAWDRQGRPSEVRVDRILTVSPKDVRREGAVLGRERFEEVAREARRVLGW
ncbi:type II toxin-antitoxin system PemK/MazF family toxin [Kineococcus sp. SYSU DK003]|uniref:type II toxin-antitoxin system PemK/MazF family toxin n=1 Tax=Kineococcus sp. SYSU DK003 TaxID=3383124 RepID=UPI003D7DDA92